MPRKLQIKRGLDANRTFTPAAGEPIFTTDTKRMFIGDGTTAGGIGLCPLDSNSKIDTAYLPEAILGALNYKGVWDANTNTPTLPTPSSTNKGWFWIVSVQGTFNSVLYRVNDWIVSNGASFNKIDNQTLVASVHGRTGAVVAQAGDYSASLISNTPAGSIAATTVQDALNELDTEKVPTTRTITAGAGLTGGGALSVDRTISLATAGTAGTYTKVTTDAYGRVTAGASLAASDIPAGVNANKIGSGVVSTAEFETLDGVTSSIQTQLNSKVDNFTALLAPNSVSKNGYTDYNLQDNGNPFSSWGYFHTQRHSNDPANWNFQTASDLFADDVKFRRKASGVWGAWQTFWTTANLPNLQLSRIGQGSYVSLANDGISMASRNNLGNHFGRIFGNGSNDAPYAGSYFNYILMPEAIGGATQKAISIDDYGSMHIGKGEWNGTMSWKKVFDASGGTVNGPIILNFGGGAGVSPQLILTAPNQSTNEKNYDIVSVGKELRFRTQNDDNSAHATWLKVNRTGITPLSTSIYSNRFFYSTRASDYTGSYVGDKFVVDLGTGIQDADGGYRGMVLFNDTSNTMVYTKYKTSSLGGTEWLVGKRDDQILNTTAGTFFVEDSAATSNIVNRMPLVIEPGDSGKVLFRRRQISVGTSVQEKIWSTNYSVLALGTCTSLVSFDAEGQQYTVLQNNYYRNPTTNVSYRAGDGSNNVASSLVLYPSGRFSFFSTGTSTFNADESIDGKIAERFFIDKLGNTTITGFTKLGSDAPAVKIKKLTGTTSSAQGGEVTISHGLNSDKILNVSILINYSSDAGGNYYLPPTHINISGYEYNYYISPSEIVVINRSSNSANILSKPMKIVITYEE